MPNLVGIGNSQVPTNGMLGGMAYQDTDKVLIKGAEIENINAIKAKIPYDSVAVFIYDTSLDSDGGAWRKRTRDASWYNEGVSRDRGARKEFPAVAVLVAENQKLTIHDGDDPNLPMWMRFLSDGYGTGASHVIQGQSGALNITDIHMLNGQLVVTQTKASDSYGSPVINFISERAVRMDPNSTEGGRWTGNISQRNTDQEWDQSTNGYLVNSSQQNCCTQHVFPNANIDPDTKLPRPTIIIGTHAGISVIDSQEGVYSDASPCGGSTGCIAMTEVNSKGELVAVFKNGNPVYTYRYKLAGDRSVPFEDNVYYRYYHYNLAVANFPTIPWSPGSEKVGWVEDTKLALGNNAGLNLYLDGGHDSSSQPNASRSFAYLNRLHPTGYLHGNCFGCFCASTDTTDLKTSSQLLTNGNFGSNITGWTDLSGGGSSISHDSSNGRMNLNGATAYARAYQTFTAVVGQWYTVEIQNHYNVTTNQEINLWIGTHQYPTSGYNVYGTARYKHGTHDANAAWSVQFRATQTTIHVHVESGWNVAFDNIYARICDGDKGGGYGFGNGGNQLQTAMNAMGANIGRSKYDNSEIVTYNLTGGAYLEQHYNPWLNFLESDSNDWTVMGWGSVNETSSGWKVFMARDTWNNNQKWSCMVLDHMAFGGVNVGNTDIEANQLYFFCWTKSGNRITAYLNGRYDGEIASFSDGVAAPTQTLLIGARHANGQNNPNIGGSITDNNHWTKVALARVSQGAISPEQVNEIYNAERHLFTPNARCILQGSNEYVRDLHYDKSTGTLHVLSNTARNDIQGLRVINSETRSAGTATIHAVNGMIVEEE